MVIDKTRRPKILVLGSHSTSDCVKVEGGDVLDASPYILSESINVLDTEQWDGIVLTGGGDIDPRCYGQKPGPKVYRVSENRDIVEIYALETARDRGVPVLGICRGMQMIVVEAGGQLEQHIQGHQGNPHYVVALKNSILEKWAGPKPEIVSLHHQAAMDAPKHYRVTARALDDTIEAVESEDQRVLGVQFHPEMDQLETYSQRIFRWLVEESARNAGLQLPKRRKVKKSRMNYSRSRHLGLGHSIGRPAGSYRYQSASNSMYITCPVCFQRFTGIEQYADRDLHVDIFHDGYVTRGYELAPGWNCD